MVTIGAARETKCLSCKKIAQLYVNYSDLEKGTQKCKCGGELTLNIHEDRSSSSFSGITICGPMKPFVDYSKDIPREITSKRQIAEIEKTEGVTYGGDVDLMCESKKNKAENINKAMSNSDNELFEDCKKIANMEA